MIKIIQGDITTLSVDVIVNAANEMMLGGENCRARSSGVFSRKGRKDGSDFLLLFGAGQGGV